VISSPPTAGVLTEAPLAVLLKSVYVLFASMSPPGTSTWSK
jgi:hypothetical protein